MGLGVKSMIGRNVAVIPLFDPDVSPGGIIIPEMAKDRCDQGIVKYVAPDCKIVQEGDYVVFSGYSGRTFRFEEEGTLIIIDERYIVAKMEGALLDTTEVPGLFFKGKDGIYFPANVEYALDLVSKALQDAPWRRNVKSRDMMAHRPKEVEFGFITDED